MLIYWVEACMLKKTEALSVDSMEIRLQVKADKTKYLRMYRYQNAGRRCYTKIDNSSF